MSKARLVITAVVVENRPVVEVAAAYGVHRAWIYKLLARYRAEGEAAFEPRSRRPRSSPTAISDRTVELIIELRKNLTEQGLDAGPDTIGWHLQHRHGIRVSAATISRYLTRAGLVTPEPAKRPRSSYILFQAEQPNETWQADFTHYALTGGTTCGKVERFQQTMKKWLRAQPVQPATLTDLQILIDAFVDHYNQRRPHRSLPHRATPATAYTTRPKATPGDRADDTHERVRRDRVDTSGVVTLRHNGRLHHIGIGRTHARTHVLLLIQDLDIRVINAATGQLLRELTLDPTRDYQPTGRPPAPTRKNNKTEPPK